MNNMILGPNVDHFYLMSLVAKNTLSYKSRLVALRICCIKAEWIGAEGMRLQRGKRTGKTPQARIALRRLPDRPAESECLQRKGTDKNQKTKFPSSTILFISYVYIVKLDDLP